MDTDIFSRNFLNDSGLGRLAEVQSRSVRIHKLPHGSQEGLLQQTLERYAAVKRVEIFEDLHQATVELETAAVGGFSNVRFHSDMFLCRKRASFY
jgi:hypothetical protein